MIRALLFVVALAACGAPIVEKAEAPAPAAPLPTNIPSTDDLGAPAPVLAAPYNLPAATPVYPGATIEESYSANPDGSPGGHVIFRTADGPEAVAAFYRARLHNLSQAQSGANLVLSGAPADVSISPAAEGGARVRLAFKTES